MESANWSRCASVISLPLQTGKEHAFTLHSASPFSGYASVRPAVLLVGHLQPSMRWHEPKTVICVKSLCQEYYVHMWAHMLQDAHLLVAPAGPPPLQSALDLLYHLSARQRASQPLCRLLQAIAGLPRRRLLPETYLTFACTYKSPSLQNYHDGPRPYKLTLWALKALQAIGSCILSSAPSVHATAAAPACRPGRPETLKPFS